MSWKLQNDEKKFFLKFIRNTHIHIHCYSILSVGACMNTVGCLILYSKNIEGNNQYIACIYWCLNKRFDDGAFTITRDTRHSFLSVEHLHTLLFWQICLPQQF